MGSIKKTGNSPYVSFGLLDVDVNLIKDINQHMLRQDLYGISNPKITLLKAVIQMLLEYPHLDAQTKNALNKKLTKLKIYKVY
jgi:hypothetical protein